MEALQIFCRIMFRVIVMTFVVLNFSIDQLWIMPLALIVAFGSESVNLKNLKKNEKV